MRVLITGSGTSGSWQIRAVQLGQAIGATVKPKATAADVKAHDVVIMIKRVIKEVVDAAHRFKKPLLYDILDWWPQPEGNAWTRPVAIKNTIARLNEVRPTAVIYPNKQMRDDIGFRGEVLYHHARPGLGTKEYFPERGLCVGYEGAEPYMSGYMGTVVAEQCERRMWAFEINPSNYLEMDIIVAFRDAQYNGWVPSSWKSNVKLANAQAAGIAFVGGLDRAYVETAGPEDRLIENSGVALSRAFDELTDRAARESYRQSSHGYYLNRAANEYKYIIERFV